ncbi:LysR family transcriptional regulator [Yinghuangia seranimata]|uniref:LysR family transcriptional regulator n=1 Tax=Yinghuangia seranimata TaxID=408067 RepID=UPI00248CCE88|nr:LysR family transcriptional regulator [Yinghuangia seranimata]MDI2132239.1 LysR family transcriptional regulator [Yinghuangia seranimata]
MDLKRLRILQSLARHGTVAAAAESLHLTPSAVSQQLAVLAKEAGVPLLERNGRGVRLTSAAHVLLHHADAIGVQLERARADLAAHAVGGVGSARVAGFPTAISSLLAPAVARLRETHPGWRFSIVEHETEDAVPLLISGELDLAVVMNSPEVPPADHPTVRLHPLVDEPVHIALPSSHPLAARKVLDLAADLVDEEWVLTCEGTACNALTVQACGQAGFQPRAVHWVTDFTAMYALVRAGLGIAMMPHMAAADAPPGVVLRPLTAPAPRRHLFAMVRRGSGMTPLLTELQRVGAEVAAPSE